MKAFLDLLQEERVEAMVGGKLNEIEIAETKLRTAIDVRNYILARMNRFSSLLELKEWLSESQ